MARSWWRPDGLVVVLTLDLLMVVLMVAADISLRLEILPPGGPGDDLRDGLTLCEALGASVAHRGRWLCLRLS